MTPGRLSGICALILAVCPLVCAQPETARRRSVLVLLPSPVGRPISTQILEGIQSEIGKADYSIAVEADYFTQAPPGNEAFGAAQMEWFRIRYADRHFDAIVAVGGQATEAIARVRSTLWPNVPLVFCGVSGPEFERIRNIPRITGVLVGYDIVENLKLLPRLLPDYQSLAVISGASRFDQLLMAAAERDLAALKLPFKLIRLYGLSLEELKRKVGALPPKTIVLVRSYMADPTGNPVFARDLAAMLASATNLPLVDGNEFSFGTGSLGGLLFSFRALGAEGGKIALRVIRGEEPESIPATVANASHYEFDWRQLKRHGISLDRLPPGSTISYQEFSLWEQYGWWIAGGIAAAIIEALLIAFLLLERRRNQTGQIALRESNALSAAVLASLPGHVAILDRDGMIIRGNRASNTEPFSRMISGANYAAIWQETRIPDAPRVMAAVQQVRSAGPGESAVVECHLPGVDGTGQWLEVRLQAFDRPEGGVIATHIDITDRKQAEIEASQDREQLSHLNRVAAMGELAASMAHELNQPLAGILSNARAAARFLTHEKPDMDEVREALADICEDDIRASEVIRKMRTMLRKGKAQTASVDLNELVRDVVAMLRVDANLRRVTLTTELSSDPILVSADAVQLQQVILNLILNAREAMEHNVDSTSGDEPRILVRTWREGDLGRVSVRDNGPGIPPHLQSRIFEPFFSTKSEGLGMGLSISRSIMNAHGGDIRAENNPDGPGACFHLSVPYAALRPEEAAA